MEPVFRKGVTGCLYCMREVKHPMLKLISEDTRKVVNLDNYVESNKDKYKATLSAINKYRLSTAEPYFYFIDAPGTPDPERRMVMAPLEKAEDPSTATVVMTYTDNDGITHKLRYLDRVCPHCRKLLYKSAGELDFYVVSIFGIRNIGKTQFIKTFHNIATRFRLPDLTISIDSLTDVQLEILDSWREVKFTPDVLMSENNYYHFILEYKGRTACIALLDTPGERFLAASAAVAAAAAEKEEKSEKDEKGDLKSKEDKFRDLMELIIKTNILLFFNDPTKTAKFTQRFEEEFKEALEAAGKDSIGEISETNKLIKLMEDPIFFDPKLVLDMFKTMANYSFYRQENSFEKTVATFCDGLRLVPMAKKLCAAVVYTKLDRMEHYFKNFGFYARTPKNHADILFVEDDELFKTDKDDAALTLSRDWSGFIARGQSFLQSEDDASYSKLSSALQLHVTDLPCFLISNGGTVPLGITQREKAENKAAIEKLALSRRALMLDSFKHNPNTSAFKALEEKINATTSEISKKTRFSCEESKSCLPLLLWIILTLDPFGISQDLSYKEPTGGFFGLLNSLFGG
jgi:hypothetical protein